MIHSTVLVCSIAILASIPVTQTISTIRTLETRQSCTNWSGVIALKTAIPIKIQKNQVISVSKSKGVGQWAILNPQNQELDPWNSRQFQKDTDYLEFFRENGTSKEEVNNLQAGTYHIKYISGFRKKDTLKICIK
jgi:hypothetical protein